MKSETLGKYEEKGIFDRIDSLGQYFWKEDLNTLQAYDNKIRNLIPEINKTFEKNEKLFNSNKL